MVLIDVSRRSTTDERMDTEPVSLAEFTACLVDLARVNRMTQACTPTLRFSTPWPAYQPEAGIDVVVSSLFTHHLPDAPVCVFSVLTVQRLMAV